MRELNQLISESLISDEERRKARLGGCGDEMQYLRERKETALKKNLEASHVTRSRYQYHSIQNEAPLEETGRDISLWGK